MPDNAKRQPAASAPAPDAGHVPITEEFDRAKWTLPPVIPIVIAAVAVAIVVAVLVFTNRAKPVASADLVKVVTADQSGNTMVGIQIKLDNKIPKQLWVRDISAELETSDGKRYIDRAAPAVDVNRYLQAFPELQQVKSDPLREELKIPAGTSFTGFSIFSYPVDKAAFDSRKSLTVSIGFYDQPTLVAKQ
jgi:hypothetical protein